MRLRVLRAPVRCAKIETYAAEVEEIFAGRPAMRVTELKATAMAALAVSGRTAERRGYLSPVGVNPA